MTTRIQALQEGEPYKGAALSMLQRYNLADETGQILQARLDPDDPSKVGYKLSPDVIDKFLALDNSKRKLNFEWMLYAAGGGKPHKARSEIALKAAHDWVIANRTGDQMDEQTVDDAYAQHPAELDAFAQSKGAADFADMRERKMPFAIDDDFMPIDPMSPEEAEAEWNQKYKEDWTKDYMFGDEAMARSAQHPVFGYYSKWPGRDNVYERIVKAMTYYNDAVSDPQKLIRYNQQMDQRIKDGEEAERIPAQLWDKEGNPVYDRIDELEKGVAFYKAFAIEKKARKDLVYLGKAATPGGGFTKGPDVNLYDDKFLNVKIPATAGAALKAGHIKWCISNESRWKAYFYSRDIQGFFWASESYYGQGPFAFFTPKIPIKNPPMGDLGDGRTIPSMTKFAAHVKLSQMPGQELKIDAIDFWDLVNQSAIRYEEVKRRLLSEEGGQELMRSVDAALKALAEWLKQFNRCDIERYPSLESLARKLVARMLAG
jgi:hypothetical protein